MCIRDRKNTDGTPDENWNKAIANKAFRQCFYKNLELSPFYARYNKINPCLLYTSRCV